MRSRFLPCLIGLLWIPTPSRAAELSAADLDFFEKKIRPVLIDKCYECHSASAKKVQAKLLLDTRDAIRKGGESGPAVIPGKPEDSIIIKALRYEKLKMPPSGRLSDPIVADFEKWISTGAADPRETPANVVAINIDFDAAKKTWTFQPPRAQSSPKVKDAKWPIQKIDHFILAKLEANGLTPAPAADARTLLRRLYFDMIGLPPSPEEVDAFVSAYAAKPQAALEKVVDDLLKSPHYGERWARLWLDVARYAEDQAHIVGSDASLTYPNAYLYRDWVIESLNTDMPYDRFIKLQIAADQIDAKDTKQLPALGFLGLGPKYYDRGKLMVMADEWEDRVDIVGRGLLGLTVACARCHDHKFDPIPTTDYHALAGVFASTRMMNMPLNDKVEKRDKSPDEAKAPKDAMHIVRDGTVTDLTVFIRGNTDNKGPQVKRHFLTVLSAGEPNAFEKGSGRQELANAIADKNNPLTARVIVNRVWSTWFGRGIVATPSNFGTLGEKPTHPELLDDLATRFMQNGWSLKWLHKEIALSAAYRQSSEADVKKKTIDGDNRWLSHMPRRKLTVEMWRDSILGATGKIDRTIGGKSINPLDLTATRRTVYSAASRLELNKMLSMFDYPDPNIHADRRVETTTPLQKLFLLNSPWIVEQSSSLLARLQQDISSDETKRIDRAYRLLYARPATEKEINVGVKFLAKDGDPTTSWRSYCHALLAANEMMFVD
jgi:Protein of unknown function (DUF1553)/Protein of unknown function (DUF1549)/Planctomycete cytochrome C